jgi:hypothetical protein
VTVTANTGWAAGQVSEFEAYAGGSSPPPTTTTTTPPAGNLARGRSATATSQSDVYGPSRTTDGDPGTYWESANNAFPQSVTVDLGTAVTVGRVVLKLPTPTAWTTRTQTLAVEGSTDGTTYRTLAASAGQTFNPATGNTATTTFTAGQARYVRVTITANTGWPAGQVGEFEVYTS